jgi:hypothetical protein
MCSLHCCCRCCCCLQVHVRSGTARRGHAASPVRPSPSQRLPPPDPVHPPHLRCTICAHRSPHRCWLSRGRHHDDNRPSHRRRVLCPSRGPATIHLHRGGRGRQGQPNSDAGNTPTGAPSCPCRLQRPSQCVTPGAVGPGRVCVLACSIRWAVVPFTPWYFTSELCVDWLPFGVLCAKGLCLRVALVWCCGAYVCARNTACLCPIARRVAVGSPLLLVDDVRLCPNSSPLSLDVLMHWLAVL